MKMKTIIAVAALACASVASASTNYVEVAKKNWSLVAVVQQMAKDPELADRAAFRKTLEAVDVCMATNGSRRGFQTVPRCCPLTAKAALTGCDFLSDKARMDALAHCGYDTDIRSPELCFDGRWLSEENEEVVWSFTRADASGSEKDTNGETLWHPIQPVKWYRTLPEWAE